MTTFKKKEIEGVADRFKKEVENIVTSISNIQEIFDESIKNFLIPFCIAEDISPSQARKLRVKIIEMQKTKIITQLKLTIEEMENINN